MKQWQSTPEGHEGAQRAAVRHTQTYGERAVVTEYLTLLGVVVLVVEIVSNRSNFLGYL